MQQEPSISARLRKWEASCSHAQIVEALRTVIDDCKVAADRIEELEALLRSVHPLIEAVYGYHHAQDPGLRNASERQILSMLDSISDRCEAAIFKEKHSRPVVVAG
jgi:hypothetical protein